MDKDRFIVSIARDKMVMSGSTTTDPDPLTWMPELDVVMEPKLELEVLVILGNSSVFTAPGFSIGFSLPSEQLSKKSNKNTERTVSLINI